MDDRSQPTSKRDTTSRTMSRRAVVRTAAWTTPVIAVVATASPAAASPGVPNSATLALSWNPNGFRSLNNAGYSSGTPSAVGNIIATDIQMSIVGGPLTNLQCVVQAAPGTGVAPTNSSVVGSNGGTTWAASNGTNQSDWQTAGWTCSTAKGSNANPMVFSHVGGNPAALKVAYINFGDTDLPITCTFSALELTGTKTLTITATGSGNFITGV